ncbi:MAG: 23S rRNA methyltransferase [Nitrococcus sp.]|nr:23S rRNA methyltransferase [Nitrococcus sp.]
MSASQSSHRWLKAHLRDPSVRRAHNQGYRSRAVYKLLEIDRRDRLLHRGMTVVDLGAAPGSWSQYCSERLGTAGRVIALDVLSIAPLPGVEMIQSDLCDDKARACLIDRLQGCPAQLVLSDMAPNISGLTAIDQPRAMRLAETALEFACHALGRDGSFLVKGFQGEGLEDYVRRLRECFRKVVIRKPKASRARSREVYLLARHTVCSKV